MLSFGLPETPDPPYGVWVSDDPRLVFFIKPQYRILEDWPWYVGIYTEHDIETKMVVRFGPAIIIEVCDLPAESETSSTRGSVILLTGVYRMIRGEFHFELNPVFQERLGIQTVILHRVEEYEPIDPYYWFTHFFPRTEDVVVPKS